MTKLLAAGITLAAATLGIGTPGYAQAPAGAGPQDQIAALKQTMQQGMTAARKYEWIETTIISLKGEEKARTQNRCYYGADGKVQKISLDPAPAATQESGGRGGRRGARLKEKIVENKKDEMQEYMGRAAALIHSYVPPAPEKIQAAKDAGRLKATPSAGGQLSLAISQYLQPGDLLTLGVDGSTHRLTAVGVDTYLDRPEDAVTLAVQMSALPDGAIYASQTTLEAKAKNVTVVVQNSGHRPVQR